MTYPNTFGLPGTDRFNAWNGAGAALPPGPVDTYAPRPQLNPYSDHFLGGRLVSGPTPNTLLPIVGQPVGPSLLTRIVARGSNGDEVSQLQQFLNGRLDPSPCLLDNGFFDEKTHEAVIAFQRSSGLKPDGRVDKRTWFKLLFGGRVAWPQKPQIGNIRAPTSSSIHPVAAWSVADKFDVVLTRTALQLPGDLRFTFQQVLDSGMRKYLSHILTNWAGALATNGSEAILLGLYALRHGRVELAALDVIEDFNSCLTAASNASKQTHLDHAATYLARVITRLGITLFLTVIYRIVTRHDAKRDEAKPTLASSSGAAGQAIDMRTGISDKPALRTPAPPAAKSEQAAPPKINLVGKNWHNVSKTIFPGQQSYQNCGLQSSRQIVEQAIGQCLKKTELEFLDDAIKDCGAAKAANHPGDSGGTSANVRKCVLKQYGVDSTVQSATVANVDKALKDGKGIIMSADVDVLWQGKINNPGTGRHAVVITHGVYDHDGNLIGVSVNDTGINQRYILTKKELQDALDSGSGSLNVTDKRIWPRD